MHGAVRTDVEIAHFRAVECARHICDDLMLAALSERGFPVRRVAKHIDIIFEICEQ